MAHIQSQGRFRFLVVNNASPFDATARLLTRYVPDGGSLQQPFLLGSVTSMEQRLFEIHGVTNGEEVAVQIQGPSNKDDGWTGTSSEVYITFTSSSLLRARYVVEGTKQAPVIKFDGLLNDTIVTPLPPLSDHIEKKEEVKAKPVPEPPSKIKSKYRWMQCTVQNRTQFSIVYNPAAYFESGQYDDRPTDIKPYDIIAFTVCSDNGETGAEGGAAFCITLDGVARYSFALGWRAPVWGPYTAGVAESTNPKDGYDIWSDEGQTIKSKQEFTALDDGGKEVKFRFEITATPGRKTLFVVRQHRVE